MENYAGDARTSEIAPRYEDLAPTRHLDAHDEGVQDRSIGIHKF